MRYGVLSLLFLSMLFLNSASWSDTPRDCDVLVRLSDFVVKEIEGVRYQVIRPGAIEASLEQTQCAPVTAELQRLRQQLARQNALLTDQEGLLSRYDEQLASYRGVLERSASLNQSYRGLSEDYQQQLQRYETVSDSLSQVAHDLDDLSGEYRSLALQMTRRYRLGAALGTGNEGGVAKQLHFGVERLNLYLHEYEGNTSALVGAEMHW